MAMCRNWQAAVAAILVLLGSLPAAAASLAVPYDAEAQAASGAIEIDADRSLLVRQPALLGGLSFGAVMEQLAASAGEVDGKAMFRQWWSTLGEGPDELVEAGLACPAPGSRRQLSTLNAFPMLCDPYLAWIGSIPDPLGETGKGPFLIIAAVNRVDLMPPDPDPRHCGEYRLVVAHDPGWSGWPEYRPGETLQVFVNFEAVIANPGRDQAFCQAIQRFWASLSGGPESSDETVSEALRRFYLEGGKLTKGGELLDASAPAEQAFTLPPAISAANLGGDEGDRRGQVRINTRTANGWVLREFEFRRFGKALRLVPVPAEGAPDASLFERNAAGAGALAKVIRAQADLLAPGIDTFDFMPRFTGVEATQWVIPLHGMSEAQFSYSEILGNEPWASDPVRDSIKALAASAPGMRTPGVVKRLEVLSCAGCHRYVRGARAGFVDDGGRAVKWPPSIRFTHILPELDRTGRYLISDALACVLLPQRERRMRQVLGQPSDPTPEDPAASERCKLYFE